MQRSLFWVTSRSVKPMNANSSPRPLQFTARIYQIYPHTRLQSRAFSAGRWRLSQHRKESFSSRLRQAWNSTPVRWYSIPTGVGIAFLGFLQFQKVREREQTRIEEEARRYEEENGDSEDGRRPKKRPRIRPSGPWSVQIMSTLPLKALSRLWGKFNEIPLPYYLRPAGFKLYSYIFGVNLHEVEQEDLHVYPNLAAFFYRRLKPGVRPLDPDLNAVLSPADGKIVQFGKIGDRDGELEQVKGVTYSLDALLGSQKPGSGLSTPVTAPPNQSAEQSENRGKQGEQEVIEEEEKFAQINGLSYTLPNLLSGDKKTRGRFWKKPVEQHTTSLPSSEAEVRADLALGESWQTSLPWWFPKSAKEPTALYYCVIYLAPGDYHRFHSPVSWVVERRRHFAGELYSVSPFLVKNLPGLFTLNERVVLLGRWRWGFFSYTPVGATNVGSIKVNFDAELRTNSLLTDTAADKAAEEAALRGEQYTGFAEATYEGSSKVLHGHALSRGEEMGGFQLGSTIVLVFEAPKGERKSFDVGFAGGERKGGYKWEIQTGQKVKVGQALGYVIEDK